MKTMDLNAYGVSEMNCAEMQHVDGGNWFKTISQLLEWAGIYEVAEAFVEGFTEGVKEGYNDQQNKK